MGAHLRKKVQKLWDLVPDGENILNGRTPAIIVQPERFHEAE